MMGSPFYYDVFFDDGPGEYIFHDCMWSGICTCCIKILHQDSGYDSAYVSKLQNLSSAQPIDPSPCSNNNSLASATIYNQNNANNTNNTINNTIATNTSHSINTSSQFNKNDDIILNHNSCAITEQSTKDLDSTSPDTASSSPSTTISPKPIRRREHNDSERKRRDHLRNAFNSLRDQVPHFKSFNKKPPRIQILYEATSYVQKVIKESQDLERRLAEEKQRHEKLQNQFQNNQLA